MHPTRCRIIPSLRLHPVPTLCATCHIVPYTCTRPFSTPPPPLSLRVRVRFTFSITEPVTCASTRYIYIYRWFSFFSLDLSLLFHCFARCYARNRSHSSSCRRIDSNARELRGQVSREIQGGTVYHVDALSLDPPVETNAFSLSLSYIYRMLKRCPDQLLCSAFCLVRFEWSGVIWSEKICRVKFG